MRSKITSKFQITIPKQIREKLMLSKNDVLEWSLEDDKVVVHPSKKPFLKFQGSIKTGSGNISQDIESARKSMINKYKSRNFLSSNPRELLGCNIKAPGVKPAASAE